jgi:hypothetical protein
VSLLSRVIRLESKVKAPPKIVRVVVQQIGESHEEVTSRIKIENFEPEDMLVVVKFLEPSQI